MMLVTRPDYDPATKYLSSWASSLIEEAKKKGIEVLDLVGSKASRVEFEGRMKKKSPELVFLNGHGTETSVTGQGGGPLVHMDENAAILIGKVTYALSCGSAARLGKEVGKYHDTAFIGYKREFALLQSHGFFKRPSEDPLAKPFMEFSQQVVRSLLKGHTARESVERAREVGLARLSSLEASSSSDPDAQTAAMFLWWDISHLVICGNEERRAIAST